MPLDQRKAFRLAVAVVAIIVVLGVWWWAGQPSSDNAAGPSSGRTATQSATQSAAPGSDGAGRSAPRDTSGLASVGVADLPREAQRTLDLISAGGPYPYSRDGVVFQNRERLLPRKATGYYHEYTVPTPGQGDRGARRIIVGKAGERYWTDDHYASFRSIEGGGG